ncbi:MAG: DUF1289 domain-containing protein [Burkholderiales bacterium]|nr:MAG: DUF1289 domain-containing protein [Burkholderiales bacterium]
MRAAGPVSLAEARRRHAGPGVPSPCVSVCQMDPDSGLCQGCWRTLDEIAGWSTLSDEDRLRVWQRIEQRQPPQGRPA